MDTFYLDKPGETHIGTAEKNESITVEINDVKLMQVPLY